MPFNVSQGKSHTSRATQKIRKIQPRRPPSSVRFQDACGPAHPFRRV